MQQSEPRPDTPRNESARPGVVVRIVAPEPVERLTDDASQDTHNAAIEAIADAVKQGVKEAIRQEEELLDYPELARRLRLGLRATKDLVNCGKITPALRYSNVARFHWPSVLQELKRRPSR